MAEAAAQPRATVIVPTYARPAMIAPCVAALQAQADCGPIEIVVVDDGSPAPLPDLPDGPHRLRTARQDNAGPAAARNAGAAMAEAPLLLFTDDDCRPRPGWAAAFLAAHAARDGPTLLGGHTVNAVAGDVFADASQDMNEFLSSRNADAEPFFPSNNIALPRDAFLELGGFDRGYRRAAGEDRALCRAWARADHAFAAVPDAVLDHHHAMSLRRFWRQHRNYGFGAARFHAQGPAGDAPFRPWARLGFYGGLVAAPLRGGRPTPRRLARSALIALAQVATAQGFREAHRSGDATRPVD